MVLVNREVFSTIDLDSGSLSVLTSVVHRLRRAGIYEVAVLRGDRGIRTVRLEVDEQAGEEAITLDLAAPEPGALAVRTGGHIQMAGSRGAGYAVVITALQERGRELEFDSRRLDNGDFFAAAILRPGVYSLRNSESGGEARVTVAYPEAGRQPYQPPEPLRVTVARGTFNDTTIDLRPAQGLVCICNDPSRLVLNLVQPYDRDGEPKRPRATWRRPRTA